MKTYTGKVSNPISVAGCEQIFENAGIEKSEYSNWDIDKIFDEAERIAKNQNVQCDEFFINME